MSIHQLISILILPLIGILILGLNRNFSSRYGSYISTLISGLIFAILSTNYSVSYVINPLRYEIDLGLFAPFSLYLDTMSYFMAMVISLVWFMASWYSIEYMKKEHANGRFQIFSLFSFFGMLGFVVAGNLVSLFFFFEIMSILSYFLVIHEENTQALRAGSKYLFMGIIGGLVLLGAIIMTHLLVGHGDLSGKGLAQLQSSPYFIWIFWAFIFGFAVKAGMFPVHVWLPEAHPIAPSPASVLLSAVMIKAGAYGIMRTIYAIYGSAFLSHHYISKILMALALFTMILGSAVALTQTELKRLLAYSSIAQIGYIILGLTLFSKEGFVGSLLHVFNHAMMKAVLFMCAGAIIYQTGLKDIKDLKGMSRKMPLTMFAFTIAACSIIGFPPFVGFLSKWFLALGALSSSKGNIISSGTSLVIISILVLSSILNAIYYGPIIIEGWFGKIDTENVKLLKAADPSWTMLLPMFLLVSGIIFFAIFPDLPLGLAKLAATFYLG